MFATTTAIRNYQMYNVLLGKVIRILEQLLEIYA